MKKKAHILLLVIFIFSCGLKANYQPEISVAGLYSLKNSGREVYNFNVGWRYFKGDIANAEKVDFNDSKWDVVSTPHTVQLVPSDASGGRNYQGPAWYRKHFSIDKSFQGKLIHIYFEAAMGKSIVYLNGTKILEHLGGYLPFSLELTQYGIKPGDKCLIAVLTDNSDDKSYPPGKTQRMLDFAYHGGIYRDVWMIATSDIYITDPNKAGKTAGGGIFTHYGDVNKKKAEIFIDTDIMNESQLGQSVTVLSKIYSPSGKILKTIKSNIKINKGESQQVRQTTTIENPELWSPDSPTLYKIETVLSSKGKNLDGGVTRIGLRKAEFRGKDGFWLNGERADKLIGGNRHQDYAYVGNAVPNSQHWRDAKKLRDAGCRIIRVAHYPQDPSFMDACDELGMFVIVATPGWQYWNKDPKFAELVCDDIRNMIRRDRNHVSVLMWEPILNETRFPLEFSLKAHQLTHEEYPYPGCFCVADVHSDGVEENYEVVYGWPKDTANNYKQCIFTREFGENVDDWYAHNTNNRAARSWGERPQIVQALQLAKAYNEMYPQNHQFIGGTLWHPFDHQRGYHPDTYFGGLMDVFRQTKYSYYMFKSQVNANLKHPLSETGPMVYIAHEISPYSDPDVVVFSNCDEVRLIVYGKDTLIQKVPRQTYGMPNPPVIFKDVYSFNEMRLYPYVQKNWQQVSFVAEGLIDGKVVCSTKKMPSRRSTKLQLSIDNEGQQLIADGSDFIPVICEVTDDEGNVRRLAKEEILFSIEGEGEIIGDATIGANPRVVEFGSAPALIRSTTKPGKIKIYAKVLYEGINAPSPTEIEFESIPSTFALNYLEKPQVNQEKSTIYNASKIQISDEQRKKELNEVEKQQTDFGEKFK